MGFRSRFASGLPCPDPGHDEASLLAFLLDLARRWPMRAVLFPADDAFLYALTHLAPRLQKPFLLPFSPWPAPHTNAHDQLRQTAERAGMTMAETVSAGDELWALGSYMDNQSRALALFTAKLQREDNYVGPRRGVAIATWDAEVADLGVRLLKELHFHGVSLISFDRGSDDHKLHLVAFTPRPWAWQTIARASGVDLVVAAYRDTIGKSYVARRQSDGARWRVSLAETLGAEAAAERRPPAQKRRAALTQLGRDGMFALSDPLPAAVALVQALRSHSPRATEARHP
ncbi:MAG: hypothetical protein ACLQUT_05820 [Thermoleophilia bacterium]